jgi:hypothetical protein
VGSVSAQLTIFSVPPITTRAFTTLASHCHNHFERALLRSMFPPVSAYANTLGSVVLCRPSWIRRGPKLVIWSHELQVHGKLQIQRVRRSCCMNSLARGECLAVVFVRTQTKEVGTASGAHLVLLPREHSSFFPLRRRWVTFAALILQHSISTGNCAVGA